MSSDDARRLAVESRERLAKAVRQAGEAFQRAADALLALGNEVAATTEAVRGMEAHSAAPRGVDVRPGPPQKVDFGPPRHCEACGEQLVRRRSAKTGRLEPPHHFAARRFCDQECFGTYRRTVTAPDTKTCLECGEEFERPPTAGHAKFLERKYCSTSCSGKARGRRLAARHAMKAEAEPKPLRASKPRSEPRPAPRPKPRPPLPRPDEKRPPRVPQAPMKARPLPAPAPKAPKRELSRPGEHRMEVLGEPCPHHPSEKVNAFGKCPACVSGGSWAARQREVVFRPHPEGGR